MRQQRGREAESRGETDACECGGGGCKRPNTHTIVVEYGVEGEGSRRKANTAMSEGGDGLSDKAKVTGKTGKRAFHSLTHSLTVTVSLVGSDPTPPETRQKRRAMRSSRPGAAI